MPQPATRRTRSRRLLAVLAVVFALALLSWWWTLPAGSLARSTTPGAPPPAGERPRPPLPSIEAPDGDGRGLLAEEPAPDDEAAWTRPFEGLETVLPNGLTVIVVPRDDTNRVAARVVVRAGGAEDEVPGVAHLLEHLMFRGTARLGTVDFAAEAPHLHDVEHLLDQVAAQDHTEEELEPALAEAERAASRFVLPGETLQLLQRIGATRINGTTTPDATTYQVELPESALRAWATLERERFSGSVLRGFRAERDIVLDELRLRYGHAGRDARSQLRAALYAGHPYSRGVGGTPETVGGAVPADARGYFERWYAPRAMAVVLVGGVSAEDAVNLVAETLGTLPDRPVSRPRRPPLRAGSGEVPISGVREFAAWAVPPLPARERAALEVAAMLIASRLEREEGASAVEASVTPLRDATEVSVRMSCPRNRCGGLVRSAVSSVSATQPSACSVARGRALVRVSALTELEDLSSHADALAEAWVRGEDLADQRDGILAYTAVTPAAVRAAAATLDRSRPLRGVPTGNQDPPPRVETALEAGAEASGHSSTWTEVVGLVTPAELADPPAYERSADGSVLVAPGPGSGLFEATLHFPGGWIDDPWRCRALGQLVVVTSCSSEIPAGVRVSSRCDADEASLVLRGDHGTAARAVTGMLAALPEWDPDRFRTAPSRPPERRESRRSANFLVQPLPAFPSGTPPNSELVAALARLGRPDRLEVVGDYPLDEVVTWTPRAAARPLPDRPLRQTQRPVVIVDREATAELQWNLGPWRLEDEPVYTFLEAWWTGPGGTFFTRLREREARSYVVSARLERGGGTEADPVRLVVFGAGASSMLELVAERPTDDGFERARATAVSTALAPIPARQVPEVVRHRLALGIPDADLAPRLLAGLEHLDLADVARVLDHAGGAVVVVPSLGAAERAALQAAGVQVEDRH